MPSLGAKRLSQKTLKRGPVWYNPLIKLSIKTIFLRLSILEEQFERVRISIQIGSRKRAKVRRGR